ncbi:MAG: quinone oxidoreductase [Acinetobacter sp.]|uniref:quinone oxidoreductase family protein n=1 Tax=Acinetobacter sp. TaxID=472 RepID=UPI002584C5B2|nr:quinone oxidoreductase [Acinetobacter sp.]MCE1270655.1 quinone oxidoreductase [Acinetobacter sp.]
MAERIYFNETGAPEVLRLESVEIGEAQAGQVRLSQKAIALNFADTYFRSGLYPVPLPAGIGCEASGIVTAVGAGVDQVKVGDRVTYTGAFNTLGAYSTERLIDASTLLTLPDAISFDTAAAITMKGLTAAYLLRRLYDFKAGQTILVHAAAGGLGLLLAQWAKLLALTVIGTVSSEEKAQIALEYGCDYVLQYGDDVVTRVRELTSGRGVDVVFDGVGKDTFETSLDSLKRRGLMVCVGTASGLIPPFDPQILARKGSLFLTRPAAADYLIDVHEKQALAQELFGHILSGKIRVDIHHRYALQDAVQAHRDLEARKLIGSSIFIV